MELEIYQVDAFTHQTFKGNPAAICPLEQWIDDEVMQAIAAENNLSETAFFVPDGERFQLRWFTPAIEVDLCGHATLATAHVLYEHLSYTADEIRFDTRSGELVVKQHGQKLQMDFPAQPAEPTATPAIIIEALGANPVESLIAEDWFIVFENEIIIQQMTPNLELLKQLDLRGVCVTALGDDVDFVSRFFGPKAGINEDPVTGSTHCTLTPYWAGKLNKNNLHARQISARSGELYCSLNGSRVLISGECADYLHGKITL